MGVTLSPFRYLQVARYLFQRWFDRTHRPVPSSIWKGKARANPTSSLLAMSPSFLGSSSSNETQAGSSKHHSHHQYHKPKAAVTEGGKVHPEPGWPKEPSEIYRLMNDERLLIPGAVKPPREIVVLCHGLYGFSTATPIPLFPSLKLHYWASVLEVLRDRMGVKVVVVGVKGTGSIKERAEQMHSFLKSYLPRGVGVNFVAHSMGGLDVRHLISTIKPTEYTPLSLTTIGTPHRGSPFMDWCAANIGVGTPTAIAATAALSATSTTSAISNLPFSLKSPLLSRPLTLETKPKEESSFATFTNAFTSYLLNIFDSPAYSNLTTSYLRDHFNPSTPDSTKVKYTSVAGRVSKISVLHPLWFPKLVLDAAAEKKYLDDGREYEGNDGLVNVSSAKWGEFLGVVDETHHWDLRGEGGLFPNGGAVSKRPGGRPDEKMPGGWDWERPGLAEDLGLGLGLDSKDKSSLNEDKRKKIEKEKEKEEGKGWDLVQVGEVIDWITDLLPGGKGSETGKKQLADAKLEAKRESEGNEKERVKDDKEKKDKFDLARFYGGLMLKLREDGY
ncbi:triacylglycerol lipase [Tremella mesenterica]|uniref:Triacylglycerol lipase n=1 Tax=Tremella mesenterica TaxID=5217 RepID=A0A4Q1BAC0_TREME|nr:uncharacterized protein TREMEDRAFT_27711 [Tremella mesenterica DSM 1558]EIW71613.1 hypothetical protein TREMEDRAFT_27711 [Tremella mesenterica DSM 1558]RXK34937.1 triacylglycerol lipase [Tremella mesenterica]